jgi:hypothetical protein
MPNPQDVNKLAKEIPFAELVRKTALAVAEGQEALDMNSLATTNTLADMMLPADSVVLSIVETVDEDGNVTDVETLTNDSELSVLAYGIQPAWYEFAETEIDMRFWIHWYLRETDVSSESTFHQNLQSSYESSRSKYGGGGGASLNLGFFKIGGSGGGSKTSVKGKREVELTVERQSKYESQVYGLNVNATAGLRTTLVPKEAPDRTIPTITREEEAEA